MVLLMSVNPGFGGQKFIPSALDKAKLAKERLDAYYADTERYIRLEIDGGVNPENIGIIARAGVDTFVAGSAVFSKGSADDPNRYNSIIRSLRDALA